MERGNKLLRILDRYIGIPSMPAAALFRKITRSNPATIKTVGVICLGAIGDLLLCCRLVNALKALGLRVELATTKANAQAAALLAADESFSFKASDIGGIIAHLRSRRYDLLLDTTQWARVASLASAFSGACQTVGFRSRGEYRSLPYDIKVPHSLDIHESENFLNLGRAVFPELQGKIGLVTPPDIDISGNYIVCHMWGAGSYATEREWGEEKWVNLALTLAGRGFTVFFSGSARDKEATDAIIAKHFNGDSRIQSAAARFNLVELGNFLLKSRAVISVNTGIMHYAALLGTPTIGLHGPTNPLRWGPSGAHALTLCPSSVTHIPLNMAEATLDTRTWTRNITVDEVIAALDKLLSQCRHET
jgi:ADP-heptose:LPS heptosyltransferase